MNRIIAVFDFDGTLTRKDTFIEFIRFTNGNARLYYGLILFSPIIIAYKLGFYPNWKAKQKLFSFFYKDTPYSAFKEYGIKFKEIINKIENKPIIEYFNRYMLDNDVYIITASIEDWVKPWANSKGLDSVIGTKVEVKKGKLTGKFSTPNCYGKEKVTRLLELEPNRESYILHVFGDSGGDNELFKFANMVFKIKKCNILKYWFRFIYKYNNRCCCNER